MASVPESLAAKLGYAADPAIEILLPKDMLAQIKIRKLDVAIQELQSAVEMLDMQRDMLRKQYKVG